MELKLTARTWVNAFKEKQKEQLKAFIKFIGGKSSIPKFREMEIAKFQREQELEGKRHKHLLRKRTENRALNAIQRKSRQINQAWARRQ